MTNFEVSLNSVKRYITNRAWHIVKKTTYEYDDAEQKLRIKAWECYEEHKPTNISSETLRSYMMTSIYFESKKIINLYFKHLQVHERKFCKIIALQRFQEDDIAEVIIVKAMLSDLNNTLSFKDQIIVKMIQNGYSKNHIATSLFLSLRTVDVRLKKIKNIYANMNN